MLSVRAGVILSTAFAHLLQDAFVNLAKAGPRWRKAAGLTTCARNATYC